MAGVTAFNQNRPDVLLKELNTFVCCTSGTDQHAQKERAFCEMQFHLQCSIKSYKSYLFNARTKSLIRFPSHRGDCQMGQVGDSSLTSR